MKNYIFLVFLMFNLNTSAQKIERFYDYNWKLTEDMGIARYYSLIVKKDSLWERKDYYLQEKKLQMKGNYLDKDTKIGQGTFHFYHANGYLQSVGDFLNGKKNGVWLGYSNNGSMIDSAVYESGNITGTRLSWHSNGYLLDSSIYNLDGSGIAVRWFDNGVPSEAGKYSAGRKQHGKWQFFHKNGKLSSIEIFDTSHLIAKQYFDEAGEALRDTTSVDKEALFPGGLKAWKKYLENNLYFPTQYKITGSDQAVVVVDWAVDTDGSIQNVIVSGPFHPDFDKIAVEVVKKSPKWIPAVSHNRKVKYFMRQPVVFAQY